MLVGDGQQLVWSGVGWRGEQALGWLMTCKKRINICKVDCQSFSDVQTVLYISLPAILALSHERTGASPYT